MTYRSEDRAKVIMAELKKLRSRPTPKMVTVHTKEHLILFATLSSRKAARILATLRALNTP